MTSVLCGVIPPLITPLLDDTTLDEAAFRALLRRTAAGGVDGLFVGGTSGLGPLLPDRVWDRAMEVAREEVGQRLALLGGVMETSTPRAIERIRRLEALGYRRFVLTPTFYVVPQTDAEFLAHFGACREATAMEMIAYNIPPCTGSSMRVETLLEMARREWVRACKDSSGNREFFADLCRRGREVGLAVFQGNKLDLRSLAELGAGGIVPVPGNVAPHAVVEAWKARASTDPATVAKAQASLDALWSALVSGFDFLSGSVYALSRLGIGTGHMITPLQPLPTERKREIERLVDTQCSGLQDGCAPSARAAQSACSESGSAEG